MSVNLMIESATPQDATANWTAITAVSKADPASPYPTEGYVALSMDAIVRAAHLLEGAVLANGERVSAYDFSRDADGEFPAIVEAHVSAFGPSLLPQQTLDALRAELAAFPHAIAMLDVVIARGLQISLSTQNLSQRDMPHLKGVNWTADEVEINRCSSNMNEMLRKLGFSPEPRSSSGELEFDAFAAAVNDNGWRTDMPDRLDAFVAMGRRQNATKVYWA